MWDDIPQVYSDYYWVWEAFFELSPNRPEGFNRLQLIPPSEVESWLNLHNITSTDSRVEFFRLIRKMDEVFVKTKEQMKAESNG